MSLPDDTLRAAVLKALAEKIGDAIDDGKTDLMAVMDEHQIDSLAAKLPDGTRVAKVARIEESSSPRITDPARFLAWVEANKPGEVVKSVRDSYQKALLESVAKAGKPVEPGTGEVIPGIEFRPRAAYVSVTYADKTASPELIRQAWQSGQISLTDMLSLPAGGGPDAA